MYLAALSLSHVTWNLSLQCMKSLVLERWLQSTWASVVAAYRLRSTWAQKFWFVGVVALQHG